MAVGYRTVLPKSLPPTFRGQLVRYAYFLTVGALRRGAERVATLHMPVVVLLNSNTQRGIATPMTSPDVPFAGTPVTSIKLPIHVGAKAFHSTTTVLGSVDCASSAESVVDVRVQDVAVTIEPLNMCGRVALPGEIAESPPMAFGPSTPWPC